MSAELRALAEKAEHRRWFLGDLERTALVADSPDGYVIARLNGEQVRLTDTERSFIAAASPDVILSLLDERDAAIRERDEARQMVLDEKNALGRLGSAILERDAAIRRAEAVERMLAYLWSAELPIAAAMRAQRAVGDAMSVRDVFNWGAEPGDPLVTDIDLLLVPVELAALRSQESQKPPETEDRHGR